MQSFRIFFTISNIEQSSGFYFENKIHAELSWHRRQWALIFNEVGRRLGWQGLLQLNRCDVAACTQCFNIVTWRTLFLRRTPAPQFCKILCLKRDKMVSQGIEWGYISSLPCEIKCWIRPKPPDHGRQLLSMTLDKHQARRAWWAWIEVKNSTVFSSVSLIVWLATELHIASDKVIYLYNVNILVQNSNYSFRWAKNFTHLMDKVPPTYVYFTIVWWFYLVDWWGRTLQTWFNEGAENSITLCKSQILLWKNNLITPYPSWGWDKHRQFQVYNHAVWMWHITATDHIHILRRVRIIQTQ